MWNAISGTWTPGVPPHRNRLFPAPRCCRWRTPLPSPAGARLWWENAPPPFRVGDAVVIANPDGSRKESVVAGLEIFRARVEQANPGDNVGVLLRGLTKQDIARGAFLEKT